MKRLNLRASVLALAATGCAAIVFPQTASAEQVDDDTTLLERVVVTTPLRRESSLAGSTSSVTVIDAKEIEQSAAPDLPSLLRAHTGVSIVSNGGQGALANIHMRGMSASQTLVLINGVRASAATSGTASIFNIPLSAIERIEVAKGAHSAQYGADAMGGVVNIITRQGGPCADGRDACASVTTGITHPWGGYISGSAQGRTANGMDYSVGGSILGTRGYDFTTAIEEPDDDGFLQGSVNLSLSKDFDWGRLYTDGLFARGRSQYDSAYDNEVDASTFAGKIGAQILHADDWTSTIEASSGLDYSTNFRKGVAGGTKYDTQRHGIFASTEKGFQTGSVAHILAGGFEAYREHVDSTIDYSVTSRTLAAVFSQYSLEYEALRVDSGIRYDHNEQFGGATTYNVGASYDVLPDLVLRASFATGFRAPTFNELYFPSFPGFPPSSNPNLKPEKSRSYEVGLNWQAAPGTSLDIAFYQTWVTDAIASFAPSYTPENVARARITGFEAALAHGFSEEWSGKTTIDIGQPLNQDDGTYLPNRNLFKAAAELDYSPTEALNLSARLLYGAARYADAKNTAKLQDYVTVDFTALYALDWQSQAKLSVENIFDEQYSTVAGYRAPGRTINLGFTRTF